MHSFDDYYYFFLVVKHGGFSAASEASNITKSKLSRRILDLESQFNVSLIQHHLNGLEHSQNNVGI